MRNLLIILFLILFAEMLFGQTPNPPNIITDTTLNGPYIADSVQRNGAGQVIAVYAFYNVINSGGPGIINVIVNARNYPWGNYTKNKQFTVQSNARYKVVCSVPAVENTSSFQSSYNLIISASFSGSSGDTLTLTNTIIQRNTTLSHSYIVPTDTPGFTMDFVTGVKENQMQIPFRFALEQNYPNPFNPMTTISFILRTKSFVSLKVFDILGKEVATIISEEMSAGSYSRQWNATSMSSGIYFYSLQAGAFTETKKLALLK